MFAVRNVGKTLVTRTQGTKVRRGAGRCGPPGRRAELAPRAAIGQPGGGPGWRWCRKQCRRLGCADGGRGVQLER
jgi:hypothetical protein